MKRRAVFPIARGSGMAVVLLVEDDDHVRVLVESYLKELGHKVLSAVTRQGAMAVLEETPNVDLLFTDMEVMGDVQAGIELARQAADDGATSRSFTQPGRGYGRDEGALCQTLCVIGKAVHG